MSSDLLVSIILCTRGRAAKLQQTLEGFGKIRIAPGWKAELLVVDNGSTDNTATVVRNTKLRNMPVRYLYEAKKGKSNALNAGLAHGQGEIILIADDDVSPAEDWAGSAGLIGSETSKKFHGEGFDVFGIDNDMRARFFGADASTAGTRARLQTSLANYRHEDLDIRDAGRVEALFSRLGTAVKVVIHTAAQPFARLGGTRSGHRLPSECPWHLDAAVQACRKGRSHGV
jgi:glycosyltransferase involved in cell wall biosynthesis